MHRIAFLTSSSSNGWLGGANYLRNLLSAVRSVPNRRIEPVLFCPPDETEAVARLMGGPAPVGAAWLDYGRLGRALRSGLRWALDVDAVAAKTMQEHEIACVSHSGCFGARFPMPVLNWLPDFQHRRLPDMFSGAERRQRDRAFSQVVRCSDRIIVSSNHAHGDLVELWPDAACKSVVVPFAASLGDITEAADRLAL